MKPVIIIPAYQPGQELIILLEELTLDPQQKIIIVDDGSRGRSHEILDVISTRFNAVEVLRHATNLGKGQALKTGFNHFLVNHDKNCPGVVTADADGQHVAADILKVSEALQTHPRALCLGSRMMSAGVPFRRLMGNKLTIMVYKLVTGVTVTDTQTGLRGIPAEFLDELLHSTDTGYDFELDMLIRAANGKRHICEVPIQTIYLAGNKGSHFNYFRDSFKIYFVFLRYSILSLATTVIDYLVFALAYWYSEKILVGIVTARVVAGIFQFKFGKSWVFKSSKRLPDEAIKYVILVIGLMILSYGLITPLVLYVHLSPYTSKVIAEGSIFLLSFAAQRLFVFGTPSPRTERTDWDEYYKTPFMTARISRRFTENKLHRLIRDIQPITITHICELGGGNSCFYSKMRNIFPHACYTIIDNNQSGLDIFREQHNNDGKTILLNDNVIEPQFALPVQADLVFSVGLIEHFYRDNTARAIRTHFDCAGPGSLVIIAFPTSTWLYASARYLTEAVGKWKFPDERPLDFREVVDEVAKYGDILHESINWPVVYTQGIVVARKR